MLLLLLEEEEEEEEDWSSGSEDCDPFAEDDEGGNMSLGLTDLMSASMSDKNFAWRRLSCSILPNREST